MSGTRFARSGRWRFIICIGIIILVFGMIAIFHSSQQQLDETREQRLRCEQHQDYLNELYKTMEKKHMQEKNNQALTIQVLEQKLKEVNDKLTKEETQYFSNYTKLEESHKSLKQKHDKLTNEYTQTKKDELESKIGFEKKVQILEEEKKRQILELSEWKEKYVTLTKEKDRLEELVNAKDSHSLLEKRIKDLEFLVNDYQSKCDLKSESYLNFNKPLQAPNTTGKINLQAHSIDKPRNDKSFNQQNSVSPGLYHINLLISNKTNNNTIPSTYNNNVPIINLKDKQGGGKNSKSISFYEQNNRSSIIHSVENFQIAPKEINKNEDVETNQQENSLAAGLAVDSQKRITPLSAPRKPTSTVSTNSKQNILEPNNHLKQPALPSPHDISSNMPPLGQPPNKRKLPDNVPPIPENLDDLLQNDGISESLKAADDLKQLPNDVNAASEVLAKPKTSDGKNNRYDNVVNDMDVKVQKPAIVDRDGDGHEIKYADFLNDQNFNIPAEGDNFFDNSKHDGGDDEAVGGAKHIKDDDDENLLAAGGGAAGDIVVKHHNQLVDAELHNEIAADQGKEFPVDAIHLEDANDEEEDDDYSNPEFRQQGGKAIRN